MGIVVPAIAGSPSRARSAGGSSRGDVGGSPAGDATGSFAGFTSAGTARGGVTGIGSSSAAGESGVSRAGTFGWEGGVEVSAGAMSRFGGGSRGAFLGNAPSAIMKSTAPRRSAGAACLPGHHHRLFQISSSSSAKSGVSSEGGTWRAGLLPATGSSANRGDSPSASVGLPDVGARPRAPSPANTLRPGSPGRPVGAST
jgi:hypothetical protein